MVRQIPSKHPDVGEATNTTETGKGHTVVHFKRTRSKKTNQLNMLLCDARKTKA